MSSRGIKTKPDQVTLSNITKAAYWLTAGSKDGLLLYGTVGSGKSTMGRSICQLVRTYHSSALKSEQRLVAMITAEELAELRKDEDKIGSFEHFKTSPMLFIDDLGIESANVKSWGNEYTPLIEVLYHRYDRRLFTIITSNLDDQAIKDRYGDRILDRFTEMFDKIAYTQNSYRK